MPTIQEIIDALPCLTHNQRKCKGCPFNPSPGMVWVYGCVSGQNDMIDAAQDALRKYQEATDHGERSDGG